MGPPHSHQSTPDRHVSLLLLLLAMATVHLDPWKPSSKLKSIRTLNTPRKPHEEELSAMAVEPVSARAASLLGKGERGGGGSAVEDLPGKVRAKSLIQMWREMEEGGCSPGFEVCEDTGWESDLTRSEEEGGEGRRGLLVDGKRRKVRGRQEVERLMERFRMERRKEVERLSEVRTVSRFAHRRRIQTFLRFRGLRQQVVIQEQQCRQSTVKELDQLQNGTAILFLRQQFSPAPAKERTVVTPNVQNGRTFHMKHTNNSSEPPVVAAQQQGTKHDKALKQQDLGNLHPEEDSLPSGSEDLQEDDRNSDVAWEEGSLQNIDWERANNSSNPQSEQDEVVIDERDIDSDPHTGDTDGSWSNGVSPSPRDWESHRETMYNDLLETYSDNLELRELLERRTVSTYLASGFRDELNRVLLCSLRKRQLGEERLRGEVEYQCNRGFDVRNQVASSFSLMPLSSQIYDKSYNNDSPLSDQTFLQMDVVHDMRNDIANIHHEIGDLRKLVESCIMKNSDFKYSARPNVNAVVCNSVSTGKPLQTSKWEPAKKGSCCICQETQIDSLLYRCGHMCACFSCAQDLQQSRGRCLICEAPIMDVVRAYTHTN